MCILCADLHRKPFKAAHRIQYAFTLHQIVWHLIYEQMRDKREWERKIQPYTKGFLICRKRCCSWWFVYTFCCDRKMCLRRTWILILFQTHQSRAKVQSLNSWSSVCHQVRSSSFDGTHIAREGSLCWPLRFFLYINICHIVFVVVIETITTLMLIVKMLDN